MLKTKLCASLLPVSAMTFSIGVDADSHIGGGIFIGYPRFGFYPGFPLLPSFYYSYYPFPYYSPQIVTVPANSLVYIERSAPRPVQRLPAGYWYYCTNPEDYYPYVKECPSGWLQVDPIQPSLK